MSADGTFQPRPSLRRWGLPALMAGHLVVCFAFVWALSTLTILSRRVVLLHVLLVVGILAAWVAALPYCVHRRWLANGRLARILLSAFATIAAILLTLLYLGDLLGNTFWGDNLTYQVAWQYGAMALPNRAPFFVSLWVYVAAFGVAVLFFCGYWFSSSVILSSTEQVVDFLQHNRRVGRPPVRVLAVLFVLAYIGSVGWLGQGLHHSGLLNREPIVGFFMPTDSVLNFSQFIGDRNRTINGQAIRANYPRGQSFARRNVVVIFIDSLRPDHMGVYGYGRPTTPFLSRLFEAGRLRRVELALSTCAETNCGILSTLTSKTLAHLGGGDFSIDQLLGDQGYDVYRILSGNHDWRGLRQVYGSEQTLYFDSTNSKQYGLNDDRVLFEGLDRVPDFSGTPAFFQFHVMSVHASGVKHEAYRRYQPSTLRRNFDWFLKGDDRQVLTNNYDNGVLEADATIEELFGRLEKKGYLTDALCMILSDHGEGLGERGPRDVSHLRSLYQVQLHIPLLIYEDAREPYGNLTLARQIDVAPTITSRLGLTPPSSWEGHSLLDPVISQYSYHQTHRGHACYAVIDHRDGATYKYVRCGNPLHEELYDLAADPSEQHDLGPSSIQLMQDLRERLRVHLYTMPPQEAVAAGGIDR